MIITDNTAEVRAECLNSGFSFIDDDVFITPFLSIDINSKSVQSFEDKSEAIQTFPEAFEFEEPEALFIIKNYTKK